MTSSGEIKNWKKKAEKGDTESAFLIYITHTDPATGAPQDWDTAWKYLNLAYEGGHPDATLLLGMQYVTGERVPIDVAKGKELMQRAKKMGCVNADDVASMVGIDLSSGVDSDNVGQLDINAMAMSCIKMSDDLVAKGSIAPMQKVILMSMVDSYIKNNDLMGISNIYGILQNPAELDRLLNNAGNIVDSDSRDLKFFVDDKREKKKKRLVIFCFVVALMLVIGYINS